ncbi:MarR family transcriptional regulator [Methanosarcina sp.]|uniref:MarR family winged helix-turn-helix transcriptional regulator n=1 Tax=Methanosarcina sp. TaxID=2213 RepID=UPI00298950AB|nr:MarR family transcriptional regulator [Methanosarcina sp.]MDW5551797.1 MarR family transcriptional regulator [Methanosarcina sp.]MDW5555698.1 MarR family transcriptional regulator [Methanosarcina sp.]MDW5560008.1 MarR family transcriptional regulator [Methanosarcina sp.]
MIAKSYVKRNSEKMSEATLKKIILLMMERDALDNFIFEQTFQKKISSKFKNLSKNQPVVIKIIGMEGEIMPSTIGKYTGMDKSSLTRMVDDLEKKGFVFRKTDPEDRRKVLVSLTEKGLECYNYSNQVVDELLKLVDEKDIEDYVQSLETMVRILRKAVSQQIK